MLKLESRNENRPAMEWFTIYLCFVLWPINKIDEKWMARIDVNRLPHYSLFIIIIIFISI